MELFWRAYYKLDRNLTPNVWNSGLSNLFITAYWSVNIQYTLRSVTPTHTTSPSPLRSDPLHSSSSSAEWNCGVDMHTAWLCQLKSVAPNALQWPIPIHITFSYTAPFPLPIGGLFSKRYASSWASSQGWWLSACRISNSVQWGSSCTRCVCTTPTMQQLCGKLYILVKFFVMWFQFKGDHMQAPCTH